MHRPSINLSFILALACVPAAAQAAPESLAAAPSPELTREMEQHEDFLYAIRMVESGNIYDCPPGRLGEQGPYQFRREVWDQYTRAPFARARTSFADQVAAQHYQWIVTCLRKRGLTPSAWRVAAAWNGGVGSVISGRVARSTRQYAARVVNLVEDQQAIRTAVTPRYQIQLASLP